MFHFQRKILEILLSTGYLPLTFHSMFFFILAWEYWSTTKGVHIKKKNCIAIYPVKLLLHSFCAKSNVLLFSLQVECYSFIKNKKNRVVWRKYRIMATRWEVHFIGNKYLQRDNNIFITTIANSNEDADTHSDQSAFSSLVMISDKGPFTLLCCSNIQHRMLHALG